jgi:hypothetical protein
MPQGTTDFTPTREESSPWNDADAGAVSVILAPAAWTEKSTWSPTPVRSARSKAARAAVAATVDVWSVAWWPNALSGGRSTRSEALGVRNPQLHPWMTVSSSAA